MQPGEQVSLSAEGENAWLRLKQYLEWSDDFALGFIFTRHPGVVAVFRNRLSDICRTRVTRLHIPVPDSPSDLIKKLLPRLLNPAELKITLKQPFWIDLSARRGEEWAQARISFLIRLNEQRDPLRKALKSPLVLILPQEERSRIKELVPDLWAIRDFSMETRMWLAEKLDSTNRPSSTSSTVFSLTARDQSMIEEWEKLSGRNRKGRGFLLAAQRAWEACRRTGQFQLGRRVAESQLDFSRQLIERVGETPESLRDLSVSLDNVGKTSQFLGEFESARKLYEESLEIRRQLIERVGETPESLRDLSVSLDNVGETSQFLGEFESARKLYEESLEIRRQLIERVGETPESLRDLSVSLNNVGKTSQFLGEFESARKLYEESLEISRQLIERVGETPESLRDLSVSFYNVGSAMQDLGDGEKACSFFQQGLNVAGELSRIYPEYPDCKDLKSHFENRLGQLKG